MRKRVHVRIVTKIFVPVVVSGKYYAKNDPRLPQQFAGISDNPKGPEISDKTGGLGPEVDKGG